LSTVGGIDTQPPAAHASLNPPLFLVGAPRSGTSLVYRALCLHPGVAYISNWLRRFPRLRVLSAGNRVSRSLPSLQLKYWFGADSSNAYRYGTRRGLAERAFPAPVEGGPVYEDCGLNDGEAATAAQAARLRSAFASMARFGGGPTVVSKRIENNGRIPLLAEVFPEARFATIVRDGRAVAYSLSAVDWWPKSHVWWLKSTPEQWEKDGGDPWELRAREWVEELRRVEAGLSQLEPERVFRMSYEELVADPTGNLDRLARFAGLGESDRWSAALRRLRYPDRNERWRAALGPEVVARIEAVQGEELRRHGYV